MVLTQSRNLQLMQSSSFFHIGVLIANKVDLKERRVVSEEEGKGFASSKGLEYFECSSVSLRSYYYLLSARVLITAVIVL